MGHYFSECQDSDLNLTKIDVTIIGKKIELFSASGVFSKDELDEGSSLLIENCEIKPNDKVLDLGCGIGVVGISVKMKVQSTKVVMSDINERAVMLAKKNIKLHNLAEMTAVKSDVFSNIADEFDVILINPPQTAGRQLCYRMIEESFIHLSSGGSLQIVARHRKGGETLSKKMEEVFGNVQDIARGTGFRVYLSRKR